MSQIKFFNPNKNFYKFMQQFKDRILIDAGAGIGHVTGALIDRGYKIVAIDLYPPISMRCPGKIKPLIQMFDATRFPYPEGSIVLIIRPCHSDWILQTAKYAWDRKARVIYIGLQKNVEIDFYDDMFQYKEIGNNLGKQKEVAIEIGGNYE